MTCVCDLPSPTTLGCPGIIEYTVTTTTATISSTLSLGDITIPSDPTEKTALVESLESTIMAIVMASLGADAGTLLEIIILSIGGQPVRRGLLLRRRLNDFHTQTRQTSRSNTIAFQMIVKHECSKNCGNSNTVRDAVYAGVSKGLSDTSAVQHALQRSGNVHLQTGTVQGVWVDQDMDIKRKTKTTVGPLRTSPPTPPPTQPPTQPPTAPPTSSPTAISSTNEPSQQPSSQVSLYPSSPPSYEPSFGPSYEPSSVPSTFDVISDEWMFDGNGVSFPSETEVVLQSESNGNSQFGVAITKHAFNENDVDFQVDYIQTSSDYGSEDNWYESQLYIFFAEEGTYPETLLQTDNDIGKFLNLTVGYLKSKVFTTLDHTWFSCGTAEISQSSSISTKHLELGLRIRRFNNTIYTYYKVPDGEWEDIEEPMPLAQSMHDVPVQFGFRVKKEYNAHHNFSVRTTKIAGGPPLPIPTKAPTTSPTETRTWIVPGTVSRDPVCPTTLDRSSVSSYSYEVRGIGGGGAMSGLSISPWNSLWFVGTDMGTLFRSTDAGKLWYPVSHYEAKYHSRLIVSIPVGYTSNSSIVLHASCHENVADRNCVAQRSLDSGVTWSPINITGGTRQDSEGNPVLDEIPMSWYGSLTQNSGIIYCTVFGSGNIYKSSDDGLNWTRLSLPFNSTNPAVGLYFDESAGSAARYIYFATSRAIYMWKEGFEGDAREVYVSDPNLLQSFAGARTEDSTVLMLSFVDNNATACEGDVDVTCGYVHTFHQTIDIATAENFNFSFTKTPQRGFRVESSRTDSDRLYITGARGWPSSTGTKVWVGLYENDQSSFVFTLKFQQYPLWDSDKLEYSAVGIDVGYWDGGYYTYAVKPNDSLVAGGSGNFFLHVVSFSHLC